MAYDTTVFRSPSYWIALAAGVVGIGAAAMQERKGSGSAARGVTEGYVEDYLDGDNIAISTFLGRRLRGKAKQYAGQYARSLKAALDARVESGEATRETTPNGAASYRRASTGSAARVHRSRARSVLTVIKVDVDPYEGLRAGWTITNTESGVTVEGPFRTEAAAHRRLRSIEGDSRLGSRAKEEFAVGDRVKHRQEFLRSISWYTDVPRSGTVRTVTPLGKDAGARSLLEVDWSDGTTGKIISPNVTRASTGSAARARSSVPILDNTVFWATSKGGKDQIVVFPVAGHPGVYDLAGYTSGNKTLSGWHDLDGIEQMVKLTIRNDRQGGIVYLKKIDRLAIFDDLMEEMLRKAR